jgi:GIY-YIG catalytic domain
VPSTRSLSNEIKRIIKLIQGIEWSECTALEGNFRSLSFMAGIYAIKNQNDKVLYVGKANAFRTRFQSGHQALVKMFIDGIRPEDVRIVTVPTTARFSDDLLSLERGVLFCLRPKYNERIPALSEVEGIMQIKSPTTGHLKDILRYLPEPVVQAIEDHADTYGLTEQQVMEFAVANLLGLEITSLGDVEDEELKSIAQLKEEIAILKAKLKAAGIED